jgi:hypothetical protein
MDRKRDRKVEKIDEWKERVRVIKSGENQRKTGWRERERERAKTVER